MTQFFSQTFPSLIAQAAPAAPSSSPGGSPLGLLFPILLLVAMWFLVFAPQRKKQKQHQKMLSELGTGDEVITSGGIYGEITHKKDDRFTIRIADNVKVEVSKGFIQAVVRRAGDASK
ncbi:preprotein translocase subunit YajC [Opitutaceae bacterium TAV4]|uniref:preprotein translocase subunit YajC n=1 Tax=Geminisphaera colitermitum TaxID=1148786 RepID=UPI0001965285|nr:preprotein translocase subunit YajC [Geminisphaera colitermitum]RRJ96065.1 preprotein translocase subunit YajC [Opitutaceae bacterium TAV4]RRK00205.1 preprotein translocase subunit YajC [Opitutaceae bacterium TAV3]